MIIESLDPISVSCNPIANNKANKCIKNKRESFAWLKADNFMPSYAQSEAFKKLKRLKTGMNKIAQNIDWTQTSTAESNWDKTRSRPSNTAVKSEESQKANDFIKNYVKRKRLNEKRSFVNPMMSKSNEKQSNRYPKEGNFLAKTWNKNVTAINNQPKIRNKSQRVVKTRSSNKDKAALRKPSDIYSHTSLEKGSNCNNGVGSTVYIGFASNMPVRVSRRFAHPNPEFQSDIVDKQKSCLNNETKECRNLSEDMFIDVDHQNQFEELASINNSPNSK